MGSNASMEQVKGLKNTTSGSNVGVDSWVAKLGALVGWLLVIAYMGHLLGPCSEEPTMPAKEVFLSIPTCILHGGQLQSLRDPDIRM